MYPNVHKDPELRNEFCRKLFEYTKVAGRLSPTDVIFEIASNSFGMKQFKLVLVGGAGVGKTSLVTKLLGGSKFVYKYNPTQGAVVTSIVFLTDKDELINFDIWDTAGVDKQGSLRDGYFVGSDAAVMMYDSTSKGKVMRRCDRMFM